MLTSFSKLKACIFIFLFTLVAGLTLKAGANPLANQPPMMGWNSWNTFGTKINEQLIKAEIDSLVTTGLRERGYQTVVIDGGWQQAKLTKEGKLAYDKQKFPDGIALLAKYAHANGIKLGLHIIAGTASCSGKKQGSYGFEAKHVKQLKDWHVDFAKVDLCRNKFGWSPAHIKASLILWGKLLNEQHITYSVSAYQYYSWPKPYAAMARSTEDIAAPAGGLSGLKATFQGLAVKTRPDGWDSSLSVMQIAMMNNQWATQAGNGFWNDPDMLVTGDLGLSLNEQRTHFALWAVMSAPLFLGDDPITISPGEYQIITNKTAIEVDQDTTEQGKLVMASQDTQIWLKHLSHSRRALLLINLDKNQSHTIDFKEQIPKSTKTQQDIFTNSVVPNNVHSVKVESDSSIFLLIS